MKILCFPVGYKDLSCLFPSRLPTNCDSSTLSLHIFIMQWLPSLLALASLSLPSLAAPAVQKAPTALTFSNVTIFDPPANYTVPRTLYARTLEITERGSHGPNVLLATWENYLPNNDSYPYFPIYQSYDGGLTWSERSQVHDQVNGWGLRYQPFLYELTEPIGNLCKGDILLAGNSIPNDLLFTQIDLYVSRDKGCVFLSQTPSSTHDRITDSVTATPGPSSPKSPRVAKPSRTTASPPSGSPSS